jgi:hypothetical protein
VGAESLKLRLAIVAAVFLLSFGATALAGFVVAPRTLVDDMSGARYPTEDIRDPLLYWHGTYAPEQRIDDPTLRRTDSNLTRTFPYAGHLGQYATVSVWGHPQRSPQRVALFLNGRQTSEFRVITEPTLIQARIDTRSTPNSYLDPSHLQVSIKSDTSGASAGTEPGAAVSSVQVQPERSIVDVLAEALVVALAIMLVSLVALLRFRLGWALVYMGMALGTFLLLYLRYYPRGISPGAEIALAGAAWIMAVWLAPRRAPMWGLGLAGMLLWLVVAGRLLGEWQMDDAYISYRYAWNLINGNGLIYNPGEIVEGYTNFLWTLLASASLWLGAQPASVTLWGTIFSSLALVSVTWVISERLSHGKLLWPLLTTGAVAVDSAVISYGARGSGMEAAPFAALVLLSAALLWYGGNKWGPFWRVLTGVTLALASLLRPEGLLVAAIFIAVRGFQERHRLSMVLWTLVPFAAIVGTYEIWRISFYGFLFPNTFYAKTGTGLVLIERGLSHLSYFIGDDWLIVPLAAFGIALTLLSRKLRGGILVGLSVLVVAYTLYIVWAGGDHFPGWRFFVPLVAPIVLLAQEAVRFLLDRLPSAGVVRWAAVGTAALFFAVYVQHAIGLERAGGWLSERTGLHQAYVSRWGAAGLWLRENTSPGQWSAAKGAGALAYYSQRPVIDVYGLNDLHIGHLAVAAMGTGNPGHDKQDPRYVLSRKPDYLLDEWINYFDPVRADVEALYDLRTTYTPIGTEVSWWVRK